MAIQLKLASSSSYKDWILLPFDSSWLKLKKSVSYGHLPQIYVFPFECTQRKIYIVLWCAVFLYEGPSRKRVKSKAQIALMGHIHHPWLPTNTKP